MACEIYAVLIFMFSTSLPIATT